MAADPELKAQVEQFLADNPVLLFIKAHPRRAAVRLLAACRPSAGGARSRVRRDRCATGAAAASRGDARDLRLADLPQLYAKGELVGGCDIVEEMLDSGELAELLGVEDTDTEIPEAERILPGGSQTSPPMQLG